MNLHDFDIQMAAKQEGEQAAKIEVAKNLLRMKLLTAEQIAQAEGLSVEQVQALATEMQE